MPRTTKKARLVVLFQLTEGLASATMSTIMLIIRLQRVGRKNDPSFRIIVTDSHRAAKTGSVLEVVGTYNARQGKPQIETDRVKHWMSTGAKVSGTVHNLLVDAKIISGKKINVLPKKVVIKKEEEKVATKAEEKVEEKKEEAPAPEAETGTETTEAVA
jgi:small subunit ribosomal protein S16